MAKDGCEFSVKAEAEVSTKIYLGQYLKANYPSIVYFDFSNSITKKIREGDVLNLKRPMTAKKTLQIVVNSPSVLVRVASR